MTALVQPLGISESMEFANGQTADLARPRALVVDDELLLRWSVAQTLAEQGYEVTEAASGRAALSAACDGSFEIIVLDYRLPDSNDLGLFTELRARIPTAAIVLMTAFSTPELVQRVTELGAFCVLDKPFDMRQLAELTATVKSHWNR